MLHHPVLFTMAAIGIAETSYLIKMRQRDEKPICVMPGEKCLAVLESRYSHLFGVPNEAMGFLFYVGIAALLALIVIGVQPLQIWVQLANAMLMAAGALSLVLLYLQWRVIKAWCFWCVLSAVTIFAMALLVIGVGVAA